MRLLLKIPMILGMLFLVLGVVLFVADMIHIRMYGIDLFSGNSFVMDDGEIADAPTGETPFFLFIPLYAYAVGCWVIAAFFFAFLPFTTPKLPVRSFRGTE
jgi:hypothetical protein